MNTRMIMAVLAVATSALIATACKGNPAGKVIKTTQAGNLTVTLANSTGEIKSGENDLMLSFADSSGNPVDVQAASLKFHMPAMGSMAEMNDAATLTTTDTRGRFRARVDIEVDGTWEATISFQGPRGTEQATMSVNAK